MNARLGVPLFLALSLWARSDAQTQDLYDEGTLRTFELTFDQPNYWSLLLANKEAEIYIEADLTVDGVVYPDVGVRFKGNSSYTSIGTSEKKPFNIDLNEFVPGQDIQGYKKLILNNGFKDPSWVREVLSYHIFRDYIPAPKANFVKLVINGQNWGIYGNVEHIDDEMLEGWFSGPDGNRYKSVGEGPGPATASLNWLGTNPTSYDGPYELKTEDSLDPWTDLIELCDVLNNTTGVTTYSALQPILNVDRSIWMLALNNVFCNLDSYYGMGHNYYVFHDDYHGRMQTLHWDLNESFGVFTMGIPPGSAATLSPFYMVTSSERPLVMKLVGDTVGRQDFLAHMRTALDQFDWTVVGPLAQAYQNLIRAEVYADTRKLYTNQAFDDNLTQNVWAGSTLVPGLQPFINARRSYLLGLSDFTVATASISQVAHAPVNPLDTDEIWVSASVAPGVSVGGVELFWRVRGAFDGTAMADDGLHHDGAAGDLTYGASIPAQLSGTRVEYYIRARTSTNAATFSPEESEHAPLSLLVTSSNPTAGLSINEFMAKNNSGILDEAGQYEDWIELVNTGTATLDLGGMYLTDDLSDPTQWMIPAGTLLLPDEVLLIWADDDLADGPMHANFKLSADGEEIGLFASDGTTPIDTVTFGVQTSDVSSGLLFDGVGPSVTFLDPSPEALNSSGACGTRRYSALDSVTHPVGLDLTGVPSQGASVSLDISGGAASAPAYLFVSPSAAYQSAGAVGVVLFDLTQAVLLPLSLDGVGEFSINLTIPNPSSAVGLPLYLQAFSLPAGGPKTASNGLELIICP